MYRRSSRVSEASAPRSLRLQCRGPESLAGPSGPGGGGEPSDAARGGAAARGAGPTSARSTSARERPPTPPSAREGLGSFRELPRGVRETSETPREGSARVFRTSAKPAKRSRWRFGFLETRFSLKANLAPPSRVTFKRATARPTHHTHSHIPHRTATTATDAMALFANPLDDFFLDAIHGFPGFPHVGCRPAKRHRRASPHPFAAHRHPFYYAIPAHAGSPAAPADAAPTRDATPAVEETDRGFLVTARLPGVRADAVRVEAAPARRAGRGDVLRLRAEGLEADLKLPTAGLVDVDNIVASCLDGVLRVVVPKVMPTTEPVPVRAGPGPAADEDASDEAHATKRRSIALDVPGYAPGDIAIHRERPGDVLVVKGAKDASRRLGGFERRFRVGDPRARVDATCADGVLTVRVSEPEPAPEVLVPINAPDASETTPKEDGEHAAAAEADAEASAIEVFRRALPGVPRPRTRSPPTPTTAPASRGSASAPRRREMRTRSPRASPRAPTGTPSGRASRTGS